MIRIVIYLVLSWALHLMVIGEPVVKFFTDIVSDGIMPALHDYYDHISAMQWVVVSICESMLMVVFLSGQDEEKAPYLEVEAKDGEENESKNE